MPFQEIRIKQHDPLHDKFMAGVNTLFDLLESGKWVLMAATSFGKDSSVMLSMALEAARIAALKGIEHPALIISHADTGIENPEIMNLNKGEIRKVHEFCKKHGINYVFSHARPRLMEGYLVRIIGGNKMPTYPDGDAECSKMLKVEPQIRQAKQIAKLAKSKYPGSQICGITGVRFDESATRRGNMVHRGDTDAHPVMYNDRWSIAPIANWSEEEVFTFLYKAREYGLYSNFEKTLEIYADASGSGCVGVGMAISDDQKAKRESKGCGARFGCSVCVRVGEDKSMESMLELDKYAYMREMNAFRNYLSAIRWDLSRRCHIGRTISDDGIVTVGPDNFHPDTLEEMFRMILTIQALENQEADRLGIAPRIQIVNEEFIAAIDFNWSRYGRHKPFHAWVVAKEVLEQGKLMRPSSVVVQAHERKKGFDRKAGGIQVNTYGILEQDSFRNVLAEAMDEGRCESLAVVDLGSKGATSNPLNFEETFSFDKEGLAMFVDFELDRAIEMHHNDQTNPTFAAKTYAQYGCLGASSRGFLGTDRILKTADILWLNKLTQLSNEQLIAMADPGLIAKKSSSGKVEDDEQEIASSVGKIINDLLNPAGELNETVVPEGIGPASTENHKADQLCFSF